MHIFWWGFLKIFTFNSFVILRKYLPDFLTLFSYFSFLIIPNINYESPTVHQELNKMIQQTKATQPAVSHNNIIKSSENNADKLIRMGELLKTPAIKTRRLLFQDTLHTVHRENKVQINIIYSWGKLDLCVWWRFNIFRLHHSTVFPKQIHLAQPWGKYWNDIFVITNFRLTISVLIMPALPAFWGVKTSGKRETHGECFFYMQKNWICILIYMQFFIERKTIAPVQSAINNAMANYQGVMWVHWEK